MKSWFTRCAVLLLVPAALAAVDGFARPAAWSAPPASGAATKATTTSTTPPGSTATPAAEIHDAAWLSAQIDAGAAVVDARPREEFLAANIPGAVSLPFADFSSGRPQALDFLPTDAAIVIYCSGGDCDASHKVATMLQSFGFSQTVIFDPGFPAWEQAGLAVEKGDPLSP